MEKVWNKVRRLFTGVTFHVFVGIVKLLFHVLLEIYFRVKLNLKIIYKGLFPDTVLNHGGCLQCRGIVTENLRTRSSVIYYLAELSCKEIGRFLQIQLA